MSKPEADIPNTADDDAAPAAPVAPAPAPEPAVPQTSGGYPSVFSTPFSG